MLKKTFSIIITFLIVSIHMFSQDDNMLRFNGNYRIYPSNVNQTEVFITKSPLDDNILFSSCNTLTFTPFFVSEGIFVTTDEGQSWSGNDTCTGPNILFHGGDPGIAIDKNGTFILTRLGRTPLSGLYSHYSTDNGQTWSAQQAISTDDLERASVATDDVAGSPYYGRTYAVWVKFGQPFPMMMSYTDNGGQSWSTPQQINNPPNRSAGGDICIGVNGEVYVCWAGVASVSPFKEIYAGFASSTNGGASWNVTENAFAMNGITGILPNKGNIRVNGLPNIAVDRTGGSHHGWIYIVTGQKDLPPAGSDPDIILNRSTDGGANWSAGIRVNQDGLDNGKTQYFPSIHQDKYGGVDILFYDDRNTASNMAGVFMARSLDGGQSWKEFEVSDHNYTPAPIGGLGQGYMGDNIDLTSTDTKIWPVWMDNSTGIYQIWTVPIDFSLLGVEEQKQTKKDFELFQNSPNPFTESTIIAYHLNSKGHVNLNVYDVYGRIILKPVNEIQPKGRHETILNSSGFNAGNGIFFYSLEFNGKVLSRKMILQNNNNQTGYTGFSGLTGLFFWLICFVFPFHFNFIAKIDQ